MEESKSQVTGGMAHRIRSLRVESGLTQAELAKRIGTTQSAIARLENSAYDRHSLNMLRRIAAALNQDLPIDFSPQHGRGDTPGVGDP